MNNAKQRKSRRGKRRGLRFFFVFMLVMAAAAGAIYTLGFDINTRDQHLIGAKRTKNFALYRMNQSLSGTPDLASLDQRLNAHGVRLGAPIFIRIFKREFELELWMMRDGRFHRFATYPICMWSGKLGPKYKEGDHQSPEGFYTVAKNQLNPNSRWHRSFNLGYPNLFDKSHGRTGSFLMVHGGCGSVGCYAMTDPVITELWRIVTAALKGRQKRFHVHVFPFRMSDEALGAHRKHHQFSFWRSLKEGHDQFEQNWLPPRVNVCNNQYWFQAAKTKNGSDKVVARCPPASAAKHPNAASTAHTR